MREIDVKRAATQCQKCTPCMRLGPEVCAMYEEYKNQAFSPPGIFLMADVVIDGILEPTVERAITPFSCAMCGACSVKCVSAHLHWMQDYPTALMEGVREFFVEAGAVPEPIGEVFRNVHNTKNAWGLPKNERVTWEKKCDVPIPDFAKEKNEYLLFVGDSSLISETVHIPRAISKLLNKGGIDFGTLKTAEMDSGNEVREMGEAGLFDLAASKNIEMMQKLGVKKVITISPHDYHTFCHDYPGLGMEFDVYHYTQIIEELINDKKIKLSKSFDKKVTYQDPCHLGRYNQIYENPRNIIKAVPGVDFVEMKRNSNEAFCCGAGGGRIWFDDPAPFRKSRISDIRVRHAKEVKAEVMVTACPYCLNMFVAAGNIEDMAVMDIAELVLSCMGE